MSDELEEVWRDIPGAEGAYSASSLGRVRSNRRYGVRGQVLTPHVEPKGYVLVCARVAGKRGPYRVHVLVAMAFHGEKPSPDLQVRHLNGIPSDNRPENLRWGTATENAADMNRHGTHPESSKTHCPAGHAYDDLNTRVVNGGRICRACLSKRNRTRQPCPICGVELSNSSFYRHDLSFHPKGA